MPKRLILASASPRRAQLLRQAGLPFQVRPADIDESPLPGETARQQVRRLAALKAKAAHPPGCLTLAADTLVVLDGKALGKPRDAKDGQAMLLALGGRSHQVVTGVCLTNDRSTLSRVVAAQVTLAAIDEALAAAYWRTGEPADKAGGYGIQGIGGILVRRIRGSYSAAVGLPLAETEELLGRFGFEPWSHRMT